MTTTELGDGMKIAIVILTVVLAVGIAAAAVWAVRTWMDYNPGLQKHREHQTTEENEKRIA